MPSTARTSEKLLRRASTRIMDPRVLRSDLLERVHRHYKYSRTTDLHLDRISHEELSRFGQGRHRRQIAAALVTVLSNDLQRSIDLRVVDADQNCHVALLQESSTRRDSRRADPAVGQGGDGSLCVLTLNHRDDQLQLGRSTSGVILSRTSRWIFSREPDASRRTKRVGSAA